MNPDNAEVQELLDFYHREVKNGVDLTYTPARGNVWMAIERFGRDAVKLAICRYLQESREAKPEFRYGARRFFGQEIEHYAGERYQPPPRPPAAVDFGSPAPKSAPASGRKVTRDELAALAMSVPWRRAKETNS